MKEKKTNKLKNYYVSYNLIQESIMIGGITVKAKSPQEAKKLVEKMEENGDLDDTYSNPEFMSGEFSIDDIIEE